MKIIINGANGRMGRILADMAGSDNIAAGVDITGDFLKKLESLMKEQNLL